MKKNIQTVRCLEFINDQLQAELSYIDYLLRSIGFIEGLKTLKQAAIELKNKE